jgi:putative ABC transport system substrate-binding protein
LNFSLTALPIASKADGTPDPSSVAVKMRELKQAGVQFVYLGSSTFLEKQQDLFTRAALDAGLPVLSPYEHLVTESNALMSVASRDYDVGKLAATQASKILLDGIQPGELPVLPMEEFAYLVNMRVAKRLNLFPPVEFLQFVEKVE